MTDKTLSELLVLFLCAFACSRVFFIKHVRSDTLSIVPAIALIISILGFFAWGVSISGILTASIAFFVTIWNFRAFLRLNAKLVIDHYGPWFITISTLNFFLSLVTIIIIIIFRPVPSSTKKMKITETSTTYNGSFEEGFTKTSYPFEKFTACLWKYNSNENVKNHTDSNDIILFIPNKCSETSFYKPMFYKLAHDGYTVYSAEFYNKENVWYGGIKDMKILRRFCFCAERMKHPEQYKNRIIYKEYRTSFEYIHLSRMVGCTKENNVILVSDDISDESLSMAMKLLPEVADNYFNLALIDDYTTPTYGPVEQTNPFIAKMLGQKRDQTGYMAAHLATVLEKNIEDWKTTQLELEIQSQDIQQDLEVQN